MSALPRGLSYRKVVGALKRAGFVVRRQNGSHGMRRAQPLAQVVVPAHRSIDTGTLASVITGAGLSVDEFLEFLIMRQARWLA